MQIHAFLLRQKTRLQHYSVSNCELVTTQFDYQCVYYAVSEQNALLLISIPHWAD
jgi:hypothetical protein